MPRRHWPKWCVIRVPIPQRFRVALLGISFSIIFLSGCSTTSQPERQVQQEPKLPALTEAKAEPPLINTPEQKAVSEIDEKMCIFFVFGSSAIRRSEKFKLRDVASQLTEDHGLSVTLIGRANDNGSRSINLAVADARVEAVAAILRKLGVKAWQIKKNVIGGEKLSGNCVSTDCRRTMRRVELVFFEG